MAGIIKYDDLVKSNHDDFPNSPKPKTNKTVSFEDFARLDLRAATILCAEEIPGADNLYKLEIDLGEEKRIIVAGLKKYYKKEDLKGKQCIVVVNLEPRKMKGIESKGMLLAASDKEHKKIIILKPEKKIEPGSRVS